MHNITTWVSFVLSRSRHSCAGWLGGLRWVAGWLLSTGDLMHGTARRSTSCMLHLGICHCRCTTYHGSGSPLKSGNS
jgi:hypothetical protein